MADTHTRRSLAEARVLWRRGWQDGLAGLPADADDDADWRRGWKAAAGYQAQQAGLPLDGGRPPDWQDGRHAGAFTAHSGCRCAVGAGPRASAGAATR